MPLYYLCISRGATADWSGRSGLIAAFDVYQRYVRFPPKLPLEGSRAYGRLNSWPVTFFEFWALAEGEQLKSNVLHFLQARSPTCGFSDTNNQCYSNRTTCCQPAKHFAAAEPLNIHG